MSSKQKTHTMHPVEAGRISFNKGRDWSRRAAKSGQMPCVKIGDKYFASVPAIERLILDAGKTPEDTT